MKAKKKKKKRPVNFPHSISFKVGKEQKKAIESQARNARLTRSEFLRNLFELELFNRF